MSGEWDPSGYKDEFRERLEKVIRERMKSQGVVRKQDEAEPDMPEDATTNVVDFMALLQKSISSNRRTPAKKPTKDEKAPAPRATKKAAKKATKKPVKKAAKKAATKTAKKSAGRRKAPGGARKAG